MLWKLAIEDLISRSRKVNLVSLGYTVTQL